MAAADGRFDLVLGFGVSPSEAGHRARAALQDGFEAARRVFIDEWQVWHKSLPALGEELAGDQGLYRISAALMRTHASKRFAGGGIASLSVPWGFSKGDDDLGGYHLVWPRDLVEMAGGLMAAGAMADARRILDFLQVTQEADGHWPQNMWLDGAPYWSGLQMDEIALPILLVDMMRRAGALTAADLDRYWPMVRGAAAFLVRNGPVTPQDRWEEDPGYSPFTLAVEIAALLAAADLAEGHEGEETILYLRQTADTWNANIERWTYVDAADPANDIGVKGHYVRIAPPDRAEASSPADGFVPIKNRPPGESLEPARHIISPDTLALVRFGLRAADDPRIVNTVKVIDAMLKTETPAGPVWHRYNGDGYGEQENGDPFDGTGIGRGWPLLTGERAHYELAAGRPESAAKLLTTMTAFANEGGLLSEQIWDADDIPDKELFFGRPSGSAMPLVWAHAEYVKLCRSLADGEVFDMPPQTVERYLEKQTGSPYASWRHNQKCREMFAGLVLRLELPVAAEVRWTADGWQTEQTLPTVDTGLGLHVADLPTAKLAMGSKIDFVISERGEDPRQDLEFSVTVHEPPLAGS
jgi:glucoamylase